MKKNSSIYNNKRFAQRTDNYEDYDRSSVIPEPAAGRGFLGLGNTNEFMWNGFRKTSPWMKQEFYMESISNGKAFLNSSAYKGEFKSQISKFISYMTTLNGGVQPEEDGPKKSWLTQNKDKIDQYNEFANWAQSERQKYSDRFKAITGPRKDWLQKALIALKNAEIAAAKEAFPNNPGVKGAEYMSEAAFTPESNNPTAKPESKPAPTSSSPARNEREQSSLQPEKPSFNYDYIKSIKAIKGDKAANALVYHAAKKALGLKGVQDIDSYYTKDNYKIIAAEITKIADSPYLNKLNPLLKGLKTKSLDILFDKTGGLGLSENITTDATSTPETAGSMNVTRGEDREQKVHSPVETEAGAEVKRLIEVAEGLENDELKRLWKNMLININILLKNPQIDSLERVDFEQKIKDIQKRYYLAFNPEGVQQLASGAGVVNTPEVLESTLLSALEVDDITTANDAVFKLKIIFSNYPKYEAYQQLKNNLKVKINRYNFQKDNKVDNFK
jgi:hypothetical protein